MTYEEWKKEVDKELFRRCGMTSDDLPDYLYNDNYKSGRNPKVVAKDILKSAGEYF